MPKKELTVIEKIEKNLFRPKDELPVPLTVDEQQILERYQKVYTLWHEKPDFRDRQIIDYMINDLGISQTQAYRDLTNIKYLLGNVAACSKEWMRYTVVQMCKEAYQKAKADNNFVAMVLAADKIGKYTKLDQNEEEGIDWSTLPDLDFEPTGDITFLDPNMLDPKIEEKRRALRQKYAGDTVEFTEIPTSR